MSNLDNLNQDIFNLLCHYLDSQSITRLSQTNKKNRNFAEHYILTTYGFFKEKIADPTKTNKIISQYLFALEKYQDKDQEKAREIFNEIIPFIKEQAKDHKTWANFLLACYYLQGYSGKEDLQLASEQISLLIDYYQPLSEQEKSPISSQNFLISILKLCEIYQQKTLKSKIHDIEKLEKFTKFSANHSEFFVEYEMSIVTDPSSHLLPKI